MTKQKSPSQFTGKVEACWNTIFNGIECLESNKKYGFFKDDNDIRPSQCTWIKREECQRLWEEFRNQTLEAVEKIIDKLHYMDGQLVVSVKELKEEIKKLKDVGKK